MRRYLKQKKNILKIVYDKKGNMRQRNQINMENKLRIIEKIRSYRRKK